MKERGLEPNAITYSSLINACAKSRPANLVVGRRVLDQMVKRGVPCNHYTLPALLRCAARALPPDLQFAEATFRAHIPTVFLNEHVERALAEAFGQAKSSQLVEWARRVYPQCSRPARGRRGRGQGRDRASTGRSGGRGHSGRGGQRSARAGRGGGHRDPSANNS